MPAASRLLLFLAGLAGAAGVALAAAAAHLGGAGLETAATFLMLHAAALVGIAALSGRSDSPMGVGARVALGGGFLMLFGLVLFCGDLAARAFLDDRLFPMAAPIGGTLLIASWLVIALSALPRR
jgi:uncharacterized membrane protein YgdD (TMEM256/DUF423 family)